MAGGVGVLALAGVCWACGLPADVCAMRAAAGGAMIGGIVLVSGNLVVRVIVDAMVRDASRNRGFNGYSDNSPE